MGLVSVARAFSVRVLFASHGVVAIWRLRDVTSDARYWYLATPIALMAIELLVTVVKRNGKGWKMLSPIVLIYLLTVVPAIWFLELHEFDRRARHYARAARISRVLNQTISEEPDEVPVDLRAYLGKLLGVRFEVRIPIKLTADQWIRTLEQLLLLVLILCRWLLPRGRLSHDQLSQLLLVYIGTAADIVEFFEAFKEKEVRRHKVLCIAILGIWTLSLVQFALVLTAYRLKRTKSRSDNSKCSLSCITHTEVFPILISIGLQDFPFLILRLLLIISYDVLSYTNIFFTLKNTLVIALLLYRLVSVFIESKHKAATNEIPSPHIPESDYVIRLLDTLELEMSYPARSHWHEEYRSECTLNTEVDASHKNRKVYELKEVKHKYGRVYYFEQQV